MLHYRVVQLSNVIFKIIFSVSGYLVYITIDIFFSSFLSHLIKIIFKASRANKKRWKLARVTSRSFAGKFSGNFVRREIHRDRGEPRNGGWCRHDFIEIGRRRSEYLGLPLWLEFSRGIAIG